MPPAAAHASAGPRDAYAAAVILGCSVSEVGTCAQCHGYCHRYGRGGGPLCALCRTATLPDRARP